MFIHRIEMVYTTECREVSNPKMARKQLIWALLDFINLVVQCLCWCGYTERSKIVIFAFLGGR